MAKPKPEDFTSGGLGAAPEAVGNIGQNDYRSQVPIVAGLPFYNPADPEGSLNPLTQQYRGGYRSQVEQQAFAPDRAVPQAQGVQLGYVPPAAVVQAAAPTAAPNAQLNAAYMAPGLGVTAGGLVANEQARGLQGGNLGLLTAAATGAVPSAAEAQMQRGLDAGLRQNLALAASARGTGANQVAARRAAIEGNVAAGAQTRGQTAQLRAQEQAQARQQLTSALDTIRAQDLGVAGVGTTLTGQGLQAATAQLGSDTQTGLANLGAQTQTSLANLGAATQTGIANMQTGAQLAQAQLGADQALQLANLDASLKSRGMDDEARLNYLGKLIGIDTTTAEGRMQAIQILTNASLTSQQINAGITTGNAQVGPQLLGAGLSAGGTVAGAAVGGG